MSAIYVLRRAVLLFFSGLIVMGAVRAGGGVRKEIEVRSSDGGIRFVFRVGQGMPEYGVVYKGVTIVERSPLSLTFERSGLFGPGLVAHLVSIGQRENNYDLVVGKTRSVHDVYTEGLIELEEKAR